MLILAAALALMLRALVPTGWMPASAAGGGLELVPCRATAPAPAPSADHMMSHGGHHEQQPSHDKHQGQSDHPCAFAGLSFGWTGADAPALPPVLGPATASIQPLPLKDGQGQGLAAPPPPPTGPPLA